MKIKSLVKASKCSGPARGAQEEAAEGAIGAGESSGGRRGVTPGDLTLPAERVALP